jgi:hypothetical protein
MGKRKTRTPILPSCQSLDELFGNDENCEKIREDLYALTIKQEKIIKILRAKIPEAKNSDARNVIQELTDRLLHRNHQLEQLVAGFLDRKIGEYKRIRRN